MECNISLYYLQCNVTTTFLVGYVWVKVLGAKRFQSRAGDHQTTKAEAEHLNSEQGDSLQMWLQFWLQQ